MHDPLNTLSIPEFVRNYRMPQESVVRLLNIIEPYVEKRNSPNQVPLITKLLDTLSLYANGSYRRILGKSIDTAVSQSSVSRYVKKITNVLNHPEILTRFIKFPLTAEERAPIIARNERLGMPKTLGFIDGTLVRLSQLPHDNERQAYYSRKGFLALNCQVATQAILQPHGYTFLFRMQPLGLLNFIIQDFTALAGKLSKGNIVNACCVLHNYCIDGGLANPPPYYDNVNDDFQPEEEPEDIPLDVAMRAIYERTYLINYVNQMRQQ
ncbi:Putative nuclease [Frankliniella fusca]|uniref:Nuclease n=1 Tax=Frankliniella fusca TaxID=407009 RepID=A0AAE1I2C1_9NEOP|nr:Putative nuclease [Frankliniella fusca]